MAENDLGSGVDLRCLAGNVGGDSVGELGGTDPASGGTLLAAHSVEHGLAGGSAILDGATVLCLPRRGEAEAAGHGGHPLAQAVELLGVDLAVLVHVNVTDRRLQMCMYTINFAFESYTM